MKRLIRKGLMYGNLFEVSSPALVERYNRALKHLIGKETKLTDFHVDISGFSPEIGDELDDPIYLNPNGCNRMFILLSPEQKIGPLLNTHFSTSRSILRRFIDSNEEQLFALTAVDAVAGELVNSVYAIDDPAQVFRIRQIEIEADTTEKHVEKGDLLREKINQFMQEPDAWWDDVLTAEMISLAKETGDIIRHPIKLEHTKYTQGNFYTEHSGGLYVFRDMTVPAAISVKPKNELGDLPIENVVDFNDPNTIAHFFDVNGLTEPLVTSKNPNAAAIIRQRLNFMIVDAAIDAGDDVANLDNRKLRDLVRRNNRNLPEEFHVLNDLLHWIENNASWPRVTSEHPAYFYTIRASQHKDRDLVNMLLAQLTPRDPRQLFICHKSAFYKAYSTWSDAKREYVTDFLEREYLSNKAEARAYLFGGTENSPQDIYHALSNNGPWGRMEVET